MLVNDLLNEGVDGSLSAIDKLGGESQFEPHTSLDIDAYLSAAVRPNRD